ncbi:MAG: response regulator transcription factor [Bacillota bacterium]|jgi:DNA-binding response OmpR family regulator
MNELKNKKILIVDDEKELLRMIKDMLWSDGFFNVYTAENCREALKIIKEQAVALCILDVNLPDGNGFSLYKDTRELSQAPVIFLTARGETNDKLKGLELGADDYIVKPFLAKELLLRITALLRRTYTKPQEITTFRLSNRTVDLKTAQVLDGSKNISLTAKEFILIKKLWENKNRIVTSDALCMAAWGDNYYGYENTLMVHIRHLREKIEENPSKPQHLITAKGLGYKLVIENE